MSNAECPRCGKSCPVGAHQSAHCTRCFTSFRADAPEACLTAAERTELPADWEVFYISAAQCEAHGMPGALSGWAVTRDHGSLVVGCSYVSHAQAMDVARRTLGND